MKSRYIPKIDICRQQKHLYIVSKQTILSLISCIWSNEPIMARHTYREEDINQEKRHWRRSEKRRGGRKSSRGGVWHEHKCKWCGVYYAHLHPMRYYDHPQFKYQCPNKECVAYHQGRNETRAYVIEDKYSNK